MTAMEAWLAEMEMEADQAPSLIHNPYYQYEKMNAATFAEQLSATLCEHFPYPYSSESNIFIDQFTPPLETSNNNITNNNENNNSSNRNHHNNNNNNNNDNDNDNEYIGESKQNKDDKEMNNRKKQSVTAGAKRMQDHIIAERRRRELLGQLFISLSRLVPGLKKMDKTSVLGEAIKYMKQLQEKVKTLEEVVAKRAVVFKKSQVEVSDESGSYYTVDGKATSCCSGGNGGAGCGSSSDLIDIVHDSLPEIEVKVSSNKLLLKIYCENKKGIMTKLFGEFEKHDLSITNCSVVPLESVTLDITIVAQMERDSNVNVRSFVKNVRSAILLSSRE